MEQIKAKLAVLIDADNVSEKHFDLLLAEIEKQGEIFLKRAYGDFTTEHNSRWNAVFKEHAVKPVQQIAYTKGKNASDMALTIDAVDLLYTKRYDGFCIVSSDSDFTPLVMRIREEGLAVYGFGKKETSESFQKACTNFTCFEEFFPAEQPPVPKPKVPEIKPQESAAPASPIPVPAVSKPQVSTPPKSSAKPQIPAALRALLLQAVKQACEKNGTSPLGMIGTLMHQLQPDFNAKRYKSGSHPLADLLRDMPETEVTGSGKKLRVKLKK